jgi:hypothetical protein
MRYHVSESGRSRANYGHFMDPHLWRAEKVAPAALRICGEQPLVSSLSTLLCRYFRSNHNLAADIVMNYFEEENGGLE